MALRTTPNQYTLEIWKINCDYLAEDVGDLATLVTNETGSVVESLNDLQDQIDGIVVGTFSLNNNVWFTSLLAGGGSANLFKINASDNLEFGRSVSAINIIGGTITSLTSPIPVTAGGTGGITQNAAQIALGLAIGTNVQAWDVNLDQIAAMVPAANTMIVGGAGIWELKTDAQFKTALGLTIGTHVQAWDANLDQIAVLIPNNDTFIVGNGSSWVNRDAAFVRNSLSLNVGSQIQAYHANLQNILQIGVPADKSIIVSNAGTYISRTPTQARSDLGLRVAADGSPNVQDFSQRLADIAGITPELNRIIIGSGTSFIGLKDDPARTALGLAIGTNVQAYSSHLLAIANGAKTNNNMIVANGTTYELKTEAQFKTALSLQVGTHVQAWDQNLDQIAALVPNVNNILIGNGSAWVLAADSAARTALGLAIGTNVLGWNAKLQSISDSIATVSSVMVGNGSIWVNQSGESLRVSLGAAARGANADITGLSYASGNFIISAGNISMSPANGVECWRFENDASFIPIGAATRDIGKLPSNYVRNIYAASFIPVNRNTNWNLSNFPGGGFNYRRSFDISVGTLQQLGEFACSIAKDVQTVGIFGGL